MLSELEYVQTELARRTRQEWREIGEAAGVPFSTVKRIAYKQTLHPRSDTTGKLAAHFRGDTPKPKRNGHRKAA